MTRLWKRTSLFFVMKTPSSTRWTDKYKLQRINDKLRHHSQKLPSKFTSSKKWHHAKLHNLNTLATLFSSSLPSTQESLKKISFKDLKFTTKSINKKDKTKTSPSESESKNLEFGNLNKNLKSIKSPKAFIKRSKSNENFHLMSCKDSKIMNVKGSPETPNMNS